MSSSPCDDIRYLESKRTVDDRALNPRVWSSVWHALRGDPPQILEVGCGIGTMIERILEAGLAPGAQYTAVDLNPSLLDEARRRLAKWAQQHDFTASETEGGLELTSPRGDTFSVRFQQADIERALVERVGTGWDLVMANAVLDLVDLRRVVPALLDLLRAEGLFYFSINFDGVTNFQPDLDPALDRHIEHLYHQTMDRGNSGEEPRNAGSRSGRQLLGTLQSQGARILAAGGSDWIVHPLAGRYPAQEKEFLAALLDTVEQALRGEAALPEEALDRWLESRRQQLDGGELILITHQLDVCGRP